MQDLDHSFHSPKYELTISHGDPIHGPGSFIYHHVWSSYMMIIYDHRIWSSYMMIIYDHHIWWSYMSGGAIWGSLGLSGTLLGALWRDSGGLGGHWATLGHLRQNVLKHDCFSAVNEKSNHFSWEWRRWPSRSPQPAHKSWGALSAGSQRPAPGPYTRPSEPLQ